MIRLGALALAFALAAGGCAPSELRVEETQGAAQADLESGQRVVVVGRNGDSEKLAICIEEGLRDQAGGIALIPQNTFRNEFYPWFEPDTVPIELVALAKLLQRTLVAKRLKTLKVRYVIAASGFDREYTDSSKDLVIRREMAARVRLLDIEDVRIVKEFRAAASGSGGAAIIGGPQAALPLIVIPPAVFSTVCQSLVDRISAFLTGKTKPRDD